MREPQFLGHQLERIPPRQQSRGLLDVASGCGQRFESWKLFQKCVPFWNNAIDLRLLEHDFRNPNAVGIR